MDIVQAIILGTVQGLTEFVPVSSSAHLVLVPWALGWPAPGLLFDTMVHWGTLLAVGVYFWRDWVAAFRGWIRSLTLRGPWSTAPGGRLYAPESRLAWGLIIGSVPAAFIGYVLNDFFESLFTRPREVGLLLLVTACLLILSELAPRRSSRALGSLRLWDALLIGFAQGVAVAPGLSRSGATISAGLFLGLSRESAARFSFMLATPAILGAGLLQLVDLLGSPVVASDMVVLVMGFLAAAVMGYLSIKYLLSFLRRRRLFVFAGYCVLVAATVLIYSSL